MGFIEEHIHSLFASTIGASSSLLVPVEGIIAKVFVGTIIGVLTFIVTKLLKKHIKILKD